MTKFKLIMDAQSPEDFFGKTCSPDELKTKIRFYRSEFHPDHNKNNEKKAAIAFQKLSEFYELAKELHKAGTYGVTRSLMTITTKSNSVYVVTSPLVNRYGSPVSWSAAAQFFNATIDGKSVVLKIAKSHQFNEMMKSELKINKHLIESWPSGSEDPKMVSNMMARFMKVKDSFETVIGGINRVVTVIKHPGNVVSLQEILNHPDFKNGIPKKHIAWMWRRILETLMLFEENGIAFGGAVPDHILFDIDTHEIRILDLCHATKLGAKMTSIVPKWSSFYPPEVHNKEVTVPSTDTYIAAKSMLFASMKGTQQSDKILESYFSTASMQNARVRTENSTTLYARYADMIYNRFGWTKEFIPFTMK